MARGPGEDIVLQLLETFAAEAEEYIRSLNTRLLELEKGPQSVDVQQYYAEMLRHAHSLKGAAAAVNLDPVRDLAHSLEAVFGRLQRGEMQASPDLFDAMYGTLDGVEALTRAAVTGTGAPIDVASLLYRLEVAGGESASGPPEKVRRSEGEGEKAPGTTPEARDRPIPPSGSGADESVRLSTAKLDSLVALVGQLLAVQVGTDDRLERMRELARDLDQWSADWRKLAPHHKRVLRSITELGSEDMVDMSNGGRQMSALVEELLDFVRDGEERLGRVGRQTGGLARILDADGRRLAQITANLSDDVRRIRMLPVSTLVDTFPRVVRDLARERNKQVDLIIEGGDTEVDRSVLEHLRSPLIHLLRNSIDHGIEHPEQRRAAGKSPTGTIELRAFHAGNTLHIDVTDDGAGIDAEMIKAKAVDKGIVTQDEADALGDRDGLRLVFQSGFSSSAIITDLSGRGVGLDVVRETAERLNGMVEVASRPGDGTRFSLHLPLSVATARCALIDAGGQTFAVPIATILRAVRLKPVEVARAEGREAINVDGDPVALTSLSGTLGLTSTPDPEKPHPVLVLGSSDRKVAFLIDGLVGVSDVVVKNLPPPFKRVRHIAGATILGTGRGVMILNVADLIRSATAHPKPSSVIQRGEQESEAQSVLIVDDSITTRTLEKNILESAGYRVRVAADGVEGWALLESEEFDALVTDIQMPGMDGFELTAKVRGHASLKNLPVILVTSLDSRRDKERGIEVGADAYIVKSAFDQERLLETIRRLV